MLDALVQIASRSTTAWCARRSSCHHGMLRRPWPSEPGEGRGGAAGSEVPSFMATDGRHERRARAAERRRARTTPRRPSGAEGRQAARGDERDGARGGGRAQFAGFMCLSLVPPGGRNRGRAQMGLLARRTEGTPEPTRRPAAPSSSSSWWVGIVRPPSRRPVLRRPLLRASLIFLNSGQLRQRHPGLHRLLPPGSDVKEWSAVVAAGVSNQAAFTGELLLRLTSAEAEFAAAREPHLESLVRGTHRRTSRKINSSRRMIRTRPLLDLVDFKNGP